MKLENTHLDALSTNLVIAAGSVDGVLSTAALLRLIGNNEDVEVCFTQAFTVDKLPVGSWEERQVALVDLAVNNRDPEMTRSFIAALRENGNKLVAVIDEHNREDWLSVLGSFEGLCIEPQSQDNGGDAPKSSGEVLRRALAEASVEVDSHTSELLAAADAGDRMDFTTHFGAIVNSAVKSRIQDDSRRVHLARHLAQNRDPDKAITGWIAEYTAILANHDKIVAGKVDLGDGIHRVVATGLQVDMTSLMFRLYKEGALVVALQGEAFVPAEKGKRELIALGTNDKGLDLLSIVREAGVTPLGGFAQKVNVELADEKSAVAAIRRKVKVEVATEVEFFSNWHLCCGAIRLDKEWWETTSSNRELGKEDRIKRFDRSINPDLCPVDFNEFCKDLQHTPFGKVIGNLKEEELLAHMRQARREGKNEVLASEIIVL